MKKTFLLFLALGLVGCSAQQAQTTNTNKSTASTGEVKSGDLPPASSAHGGTQSAHSSRANPPSVPESSSGSSMMGSNARAIDTSQFDAEITKAEKDLKAKPSDEATKKELADAYAQRAFALTEAAQYRSALGDFRRCLKLDSSNTEAQEMHDQIIDIFKSLNREPPKEGEEPPPLPFKKEA